LFVDDDGAIDESEEQAMNADMIKRKEMEELKAREEEERIQAEQQRLMELQQIELEHRQRKEQDRRVAAAAPNRATFILGNVTINQIVFEDDEEEDLVPFSEEMLIEAEEREYATQALSEELQAAYMQVSDDEEGEGQEGGEGQEDGEEGSGDEEGSEGEEGESDQEGDDGNPES
jgi:hypothetical protein